MVSTVQKSYRKNILREMKSSISRVVSLFGIVALGVMMLTGLMCIAPDMRTAAQKYYVQQNVFDLRVLSTLGLSQSDINAIAAVDGVDAVQAVKYQDVEGHWTGDEQTTVARLYQLPADPQADTPENMNRLVLLSGRMPEAAGECVVHVMGHGGPVELGTQLTLPEETEGVSGQVFTVVGTVQDPLHFSSDSESSTVGDGQLDCILFVPEGTLTADYYTVCYIKAKNAGLYDNYSDEYQAAVDAVAEKLKAIQSVQCTARREELMDTANDKLTEARTEYDSQKAEAERQFAEAEAKLADAQQQLDAAKAQLEAGEKELAAQKAALPDTMQSGADKLVSSEAQVLEFEEQLQQIEMLVNLKKVADPLLTYAETALRNAEKALDEAEPEDEDYIELRDALAKAQAAYDNIYNQLQGYQQQLDAGKRQMYKQGLISSPNLSNDQLVTEAKAALRKMKLQLLQGQLQLTTGTASAYTQFDAAQKQLEEGWAEYNAGQTQLEESRTEYESQKAEAEQKLADGLAQLNDAEEQVNQIKKGEWYVLDRTSTMSCVTFAQYADRMDAIGRMMEKTDMPDDMPITASLVTKAIENAQRQVETMHFAARKQVLEYDDVMNLQRQAIYRERNAILDGKDMGERISEIVEDAARGIVEENCPEKSPSDDWDMDAVDSWAANMTGENDFHCDEVEHEDDPETLIEILADYLQNVYDRKVSTIGEDIMRTLESQVMLRIIDTRWMTHLQEMDYLRTGIFLRAIGQRDPLVEYKEEAHRAFGLMTSSLYEDFLRTILRLQIAVNSQEPMPEEPDPTERASYSNPEENLAAPQTSSQAFSAGGQAPDAAAVPQQREKPEHAKVETYVKDESDPYANVGRNDPCPCGSGKKFKKCHGANRA